MQIRVCAARPGRGASASSSGHPHDGVSTKPGQLHFQYQAASWDRPRRVIAKVEHHLGELFPRVGFIVTTLTGTNRAVVRFYNQRGDGGAVDQGRQGSHPLDAALLSALPGE